MAPTIIKLAEAWLVANDGRVSSLLRGYPTRLGNITRPSPSGVTCAVRGGATLRSAAAVWRRGIYKP